MKLFLGYIVSGCIFLLTLETLSWFVVEKTRLSEIRIFSKQYQKPQTINPQYRLKTDWTYRAFKGPAPKHKEGVVVMCDIDFHKTHESGYLLYRPNSVGTEICTELVSGVSIYDAIYSFDSLGRRIVSTLAKEGNKNHIAFAGCSFTFGQGVLDKETLPAFFQALNKDVEVVNLAKLGGNISDLLFHLTENDLTVDLHPKGILLLSFMDFHMDRFLVSTRSLGTWYRTGPVFEYIDKENKYVYRGISKNAYPLRSKISATLMSSYFFRILGLDWPNPTSTDNFFKYAKAIDYARDLYRQHNKNRELIVFLNPGRIGSKALIDALEKERIPYLDYTAMPIEKFSDKKLYIDRDGHPTAEYNRILAEQISHDLKLPENQKFLKVLQ